MKRAGKYEIGDVLGEGGMGVVYCAFDPVMGREVTLKTIRNSQDKTAIELFKRECRVLSGLAHPNIVEIFDIGEAVESGGNRPYFVMPRLRGATLDKLIKASSARLSTERCMDIIGQVCRGLQAAHGQGLVHRDLKPSNLFVLEDDSVKIIDFGVAHLIDKQTATGLKGTVLYMAPEQLLMKQPTPLADQFSLAVVCYEMLAHRHPFTAPGYKDLTQAILEHSPTPISDLNPNVNRAISQVVHKALAKEPVHRFADIREFDEYLQKALRNEPLSIFDPSKIEPRLDRARKALAGGDIEFATEIIRALESESYLHPDIQRLHQEIDQTQRRKTVSQLLETAKRRFEEDELLLSLQKVQEILNIDPTNAEAFTLKGAIENKRRASQIDGSLQLAEQHLDNRAYDLARQAVGKVLLLRPKDTRALALLAEADRREQESSRIRQEKEKAYLTAMQSVGQGDLSGALVKLERLLELERRSPDNSGADQSGSYQKLYEEVRTKRDYLERSLAEAKRSFGEGNLTAALSVCDEVLKGYPGNVVFQALQYDIEEARREEISIYIAKVERDLAVEADLNRKVSILESARQKYPSEDRFTQSLNRVLSRRDLVLSIVRRASVFEDSGQFSEALGQWEILRSTYPQYPGLDVEVERLKRRREQQVRTEAKSRWVEQIDQRLGVRDYSRAILLVDDALAEFKSDAELLTLRKNAELGLKRSSDASQKIAAGLESLKAGSYDDAMAALREGLKLYPESQTARSALVEALLQLARTLLDSDWKAADPLIAEALELDPGNPLAKSLRTLIADNFETERVTATLSRAREFQAQGEVLAAITELDSALEHYATQERLLQLRASLLEGLPAAKRAEMRAADLEKVNRLAERSHGTQDQKELESIFANTRIYSTKYAGDSEFDQSLSSIRTKVKTPEENPPDSPRAEVPSKPRETPRTQKTRKPSFSALLPQIYRTTWGRSAIGTFLGVLLVLAAIKFWPHPALPPQPLIPAVANVILVGTTGNARVLDSNRNDVTGNVKSLPAGDYILEDSRPGFHPLKTAFTVDPALRKSQNVEAVWLPLTATLSIHPARSGQWTLDEAPIPVEQLDKLELKEGTHLLVWAENSSVARLAFTVTNGYATLETWMPRRLGPAEPGAVAVTVSQDGASVQLLNMKLRYKAGSGESKDTQVDGPLVWNSASEPLSLQSAWFGTSLGDLEPFDPAQGGKVYVALIPPSRGTTPPQTAKQPEQQPIVPIKPITPDPVPQESDADRRKREHDEKLKNHGRLTKGTTP